MNFEHYFSITNKLFLLAQTQLKNLLEGKYKEDCTLTLHGDDGYNFELSVKIKRVKQVEKPVKKVAKKKAKKKTKKVVKK